MTPLHSIRKFCLSCAGSPSDVRECRGDKQLSGGVCRFFKYRMGKGRPSVKIIRKECLSCMGGSPALVTGCVSVKCPIYLYRFGKSLNRSKETAKNFLKIAV